ncbi:hypothetical protein ACLB2K_043392 [Fragaria x ananassa]
MLDSGATSNFVAMSVAKRLGLEMVQNSSMVKAVNSEAKPVQGTTKVCLKAQDWEGRCRLMVVPLDDYELIIGMEFFRTAKVGMIPYLSVIFLMKEDYPYFGKTKLASRQLNDRKKNHLVGEAHQSKARVKKGETTSDATLVESKPEVITEVHKNVALTLECMKGRIVELGASAKPYAQALHRMVPTKVAKQQRHPGVLKEASGSKPSKVCYSADVLLDVKQQGLSDHDKGPVSNMILKNVFSRQGHILFGRVKGCANMNSLNTYDQQVVENDVVGRCWQEYPSFAKQRKEKRVLAKHARSNTWPSIEQEPEFLIGEVDLLQSLPRVGEEATQWHGVGYMKDDTHEGSRAGKVQQASTMCMRNVNGRHGKSGARACDDELPTYMVCVALGQRLPSSGSHPY